MDFPAITRGLASFAGAKRRFETKYLSQAFRIDQRIQSKMEQVASLNDLATRATATYSDMPGSETRNLHRMEDAILSIIELEAEINGDICLSLIHI